jgi:hypothetical protein
LNQGSVSDDQKENNGHHAVVCMTVEAQYTCSAMIASFFQPGATFLRLGRLAQARRMRNRLFLQSKPQIGTFPAFTIDELPKMVHYSAFISSFPREVTVCRKPVLP